MPAEVALTSGRVAGFVGSNGVVTFKGIPFAAPPVGGRRFKAPLPVEPWSGIRDTSVPGSCAVQARPVPGAPSAFGGLFGPGDLPIDEDCLYLNVWTPALDGDRRPVMVWIHGGGFRTGTGASPMYDGALLAAEGDVVVVSINYRLGALGFLYLPELGGANFGTQDQIEALRWVQREVGRFGGDPGNVTIFGESAGGKSVETLLAAPEAAPVFHKAILQSTYSPSMERADAVETAEMLLANLGIARGDVESLMAVPAEKIVDAQVKLAEQTAALSLARGIGPVVDGAVIPVGTIEAVRSGSTLGKPVIVGTNLDESRLFGATMPEMMNMDTRDAVQRLAVLVTGGAATASAAMETYSALRAERGDLHTPADTWFAVQSDRTFRMQSIRVAEAHSSHSTAYMYLFSWPSPAMDGALGACHGLEIPFVFGNFDGALANLAGRGPEADGLSERMRAAWLAFARTGNPNHEGLARWDAYDPVRRATMRFDRECGVQDDPLAAERRFWESV